jgi:putative membrane protein
VVNTRVRALSKQLSNGACKNAEGLQRVLANTVATGRPHPEINMKAHLPFITLGVLFSLPVSLQAQEPPSQVAAVSAEPGNMTGRDFAETAMVSDMYEIQAGRLAEDQASSPAVKAFGRQMVEGHTQTTTQLKSTVDRTLVGQQVTPPPKLDPKHLEMYKELQSAHGDAFDALYVRQQLLAHRETLAVMQGYAANGREPELRRFASETVPIIQDHLRMLQQLPQGATEVGAR